MDDGRLRRKNLALLAVLLGLAALLFFLTIVKFVR
jgi:hypothetical protein